MIATDESSFVGERSRAETQVCDKSGDNNSFKDQLDDGIAVQQILLDGIVNSMDTKSKTLLQ